MRFRRSWWYIDPNGMPTLVKTNWRAKCWSFEWAAKATVFFVERVVPAPCCPEGACSKCYTGPVTNIS